MTAWDDLNARSRGLATHLLGRDRLASLARVPDLAALAECLRGFGYPIPLEGRMDGADIELAARRHLAARLATLGRWAAGRRPALAIIFEDEERRSIVALLRGAVQHAEPEVRLAGLLPTPNLPEKALEELSRQPSPAALAALLLAWDHPLAPALLPQAGRPEPDLLHLEVLLHRAFAERALTAARREGRSGTLARYVRRLIDLENAFTVLALSDEKDAKVAECWIDGGTLLGPDLAQRAAAAGGPRAAAPILAKAFAGLPLADAFRQEPEDGGIEVAVLRAQLLELRAAARQDPLSPALLLGYALRLRAELLDVCRLTWGLALGAPAGILTAALATVP
ncbi:MAG TPA: V-type ATPase subunit [Gemmatimonadales bacterium]|nr:V-type ATPase subunit [Gemmatimonadales bacterium]